MYHIVKLFNTGTCEILLFCFVFLSLLFLYSKKAVFFLPLTNIQYTILPKRDRLTKIPKSRIIG